METNEIQKSGMSLNIDDQKWIKLLFDRQDEVNAEQFEKILSALRTQDERLARIETMFLSHEKRISNLEKYAGFWSTVGRIGIAVFTALGISLLAYLFFDKK